MIENLHSGYRVYNSPAESADDHRVQGRSSAKPRRDDADVLALNINPTDNKKVASTEELPAKSISIESLLLRPNLLPLFENARFYDTQVDAEGTIIKPFPRRKECLVKFDGDTEGDYLAVRADVVNMYIKDPNPAQQEAIDISLIIDRFNEDDEEAFVLRNEDMESVKNVLNSPQLYNEQLPVIYRIIEIVDLTSDQKDQLAQIIFKKHHKDWDYNLDLCKTLLKLEAANLVEPLGTFINNVVGHIGAGDLTYGGDLFPLVLERMHQDPEIFLASVLDTTDKLWGALMDEIGEYAAVDDAEERKNEYDQPGHNSFFAYESEPRIVFDELLTWLNTVDLDKLSAKPRENLKIFLEKITEDWQREIDFDGSAVAVKSVYDDNTRGSYINQTLDASQNMLERLES